MNGRRHSLKRYAFRARPGVQGVDDVGVRSGQRLHDDRQIARAALRDRQRSRPQMCHNRTEREEERNRHRTRAPGVACDQERCAVGAARRWSGVLNADEHKLALPDGERPRAIPLRYQFEDALPSYGEEWRRRWAGRGRYDDPMVYRDACDLENSGGVAGERGRHVRGWRAIKINAPRQVDGFFGRPGRRAHRSRRDRPKIECLRSEGDRNRSAHAPALSMTGGILASEPRPKLRPH